MLAGANRRRCMFGRKNHPCCQLLKSGKNHRKQRLLKANALRSWAGEADQGAVAAQDDLHDWRIARCAVMHGRRFALVLRMPSR